MKVNKKIIFYFIVLVFLISAAIIISINILNVYEEREEYEVKNKDVVKQVKAYIDVKMGNESATAWGCDLTHGYIDINADYRS